MRRQRALHMGLPLRGSILFSPVPGVAFVPQATPGYSWRTPPGFSQAGSQGVSRAEHPGLEPRSGSP